MNIKLITGEREREGEVQMYFNYSTYSVDANLYKQKEKMKQHNTNPVIPNCKEK